MVEFQAVPIVTVEATSGAGLGNQDFLLPMTPPTYRISRFRGEVPGTEAVTDLAAMIVLAMLALPPGLDNLRTGG